ncbi:hypothetical protein GCM10009836_36010 [Pseudonocardia ailaonensis]|uniref:Peptide/nickel transport system permease protein n=1 Tax=Pseudonocardia ailaonensis TaxID=367279 RepID=A0ABN2N602_9PSEU
MSTPGIIGGPTVLSKPRRNWTRRLLRNPLALLSGSFLLIVVVCAVFAPLVAPSDPSAQSVDSLSGPSAQHWLGADSLGRDTLTRMIYGAQVSLTVAVSVVLIGLAVAVPLGVWAGYRGGRVDMVVMRVSEAVISIPTLILALAIVSFLGAGTSSSIWALAVVVTPGLVRVVRGQARAVAQETFVEASRSVGTRNITIMAHRVLPSVWSPIIIQATTYLGGVLLAEASLSFLGLGTKPPTPSWGGMLQDAVSTALFVAPLQVVAPAVAIILTVLSINSVGDALRVATGIGRTRPRHRARGQRLGITSVDRPSATRSTGSTGATREAGPTEATGVAAPAGVNGSAATVDPAAPRPLLTISDLSIEFGSDKGPATRVVEGLNLSINRGEVLGLVGESGSGKTVTAMSIMRLLPSPPGTVVSGRIEFDDVDLLSLPPRQLRDIRGSRISVIFQDPMTSLDSAFTVGHHLREAQTNHASVGRAASRKRSVELLDMVGISRAAERLDAYPHEFSGGMRQRVMIAIALANDPDLVIADEPTTALDVTVQTQILDVLRGLQSELGTALLFVTHDLGVIADISDRVAVMYAGQIVETAEVDTLFANPKHPYTAGLLAAMPQAGRGLDRLRDIPGTVPMPSAFPAGCRFHPRCGFVEDRCRAGAIPLELVQRQGSVRCTRSDELDLLGTAQRR